MKGLINSLLEAGKLDAESANKLNNEAEELQGKLQSARDESAGRRKELKELKTQIDQVNESKNEILEALGVDPEEGLDLSELADRAKGKTEADKQLELKIKRLERDLDKAQGEKAETLKQFHQSQKQSALAKALDKHEWIDKEVVEQLFIGLLEVSDEGVTLSDGISLDDGLAQFANEKPHLLKAKGTGGSGYQPHNQGKSTDYIP